jgi:thiol-disulfide isomerase/thioredoxin
VWATPALAEIPADAAADAECIEAGSCPVDLSDLPVETEAAQSPTAPAPPVSAAPARAQLVFFWGVGCPHCEEAKPIVAALAREFPELEVEQVEVRRDPKGSERFVSTMRELGAGAVGVPTFVLGRDYVIGFAPETTESELRELVQRALRGEAAPVRDRSVVLPFVGRIDPNAISLPAFTMLVGLIDGINPCAMWVLLVLLGILMRVKSRARLLLFGGTFVVVSGVVYFIFMVAWTHVFAIVGISRLVTIGLGAIVLLMGLINLKELIWFEKGVSLMIPDKAKPGLYRRMRAIARGAGTPAAYLGIVVLAFLVNLIELGCTLGLPAVYTRILTLREDLSGPVRYAYLGLYNLAYVVPLALIVLTYAATLHRFALGERGAKVLKGVSGVLLVLFGLLFILAPDLLGAG